MPCTAAKARRLLKSGKAIVVNKCIFTIKLLWQCTAYKQKVSASQTQSNSIFGTAVKINGTCIFSSSTEVRQDIKNKLERRNDYRKTRRNRKTRYRICRFKNRKSARKNAPSVKSKIDSHSREIKRVEKHFPITSWTTVIASTKIGYTGPVKLEWLNLKRQVHERDNYVCLYCKGKTKDYMLHAHHILARANGGLDTLENLITLCETCHTKYHEGKIILKIGKRKIKTKTKNTQVYMIRKNLKFPEDAIKYGTYGFIIKGNRQDLNLESSPINDACSILKIVPDNSYNIKNVSKGDYQRTKCKAKTKGIGRGPQAKKIKKARGKKTNKIIIPKGKLFGYKKFDLIETSKGIGYIKGRRTTGKFSIVTVQGEVIDSLDIRFNSKRVTARKTTLIQEAQFLPPLKGRVSLRKTR